MSLSQNKIRTNLRKENHPCQQQFLPGYRHLTMKQIKRQRPSLGQDIIDNFVEIWRKDSYSVKVVQCLTCCTMLIRPKRHYNNLRRHLTSQYHQRFERMVSGKPEAALERKSVKEPRVKAKETFELNTKDLKAIEDIKPGVSEEESTKPTGMIFSLSNPS